MLTALLIVNGLAILGLLLMRPSLIYTLWR